MMPHRARLVPSYAYQEALPKGWMRHDTVLYDIMSWLINSMPTSDINPTARYKLMSTDIIAFREKSDAALFKLTWGGKIYECR